MEAALGEAAEPYRGLQLQQILATIAKLGRRISERFPGSGLARVAEELLRAGEETGQVVERLRRPHRPLRTAVGVAFVLLLALAVALFRFLAVLSFDVAGIGALLQAVESAAQDLIFLGLGMYFLLSLEGRYKRRLALRQLHRLRSIVHIVDMHQLTKDPEHLLHPGRATASSPTATLDRFELGRYLDYCTELLSLSSKLAALHVQHLNDPVVLGAVNDIEVLAANLSNKIWQKIVILDTAFGARKPPAPELPG